MRSGNLHHATVVAGDLTSSIAFYDAALGALGINRILEFSDEEEEDASIEAVGYAGTDGTPVFWVVTGSEATRGAHVSFGATSHEQVDEFYAAALANGGKGQQAPRRWEIYRPGYYGAIVVDPDGNLIEAELQE